MSRDSIVAVLRGIDIYPTSGFSDRPWCDDPGEDAFVRTARRVCELYQEAIAPARLPTRAPAVQLGTFRHDRDDVLVVVHVDPTDGYQPVNVFLPDGVASLMPQARALLVLDVIHGALIRLAQARQWDVTVLDAARQQCLAHGLVYRWSSPWRASPDRRRQARAVFTLLDDGFGRVQLEVASGDGVVERSRQALAFTTSEGFRRSTATLRWTGPQNLQLVPFIGPFAGLVDEDGSELLCWEPDSPPSGPDAPLDAVDEGATRPTVHVVGRGATAPEQPPEIRFVGGGPSNGVPRSYQHTLDTLLGQVANEPAWLEWWSAADRAILEIFYWYNVDDCRVTARRGRNKLIAAVQRPTVTMQRSSNPAALARQDVDELLDAIRHRMHLPEPPALRP